MAQIADECTISGLVKMIDSIGPRIESKIENQLDLKNLEVLKIGVSGNWREIVVREVGNSDRVKAIQSSEVKNYFSYFGLRTDEKLKSNDISITLKSKFDSEVLIKFNIYYFNKVTPNLPIDSLQRHIKDTIIHSLGQFELHDLWISEKDSMETIMNEVFKFYYPETSRVEVFHVIIPEEAEKYFNKIDQSRQALLEDLFENRERLIFLEKELESNKKLTNAEITDIEKEIENLERENESQFEKKVKLSHMNINLK